MVTFSHRSFQEYFASRFILASKPEVQQKLINKYATTLNQDTVLHLLYEMNPELVERVLIIPQLERLEQLIGLKKKLGMTHYLRFLKNEILAIGIDDKGRFRMIAPHRQHRFTSMKFAAASCGVSKQVELFLV
jgi:predicted NACHT family NTPase